MMGQGDGESGKENRAEVAEFILSGVFLRAVTGGRRYRRRSVRGGYCDCFSVPATKKNDVHNSFLSPAVADGVFCA